MTRSRNLLAKLRKVAVYRPFFLLSVRAHPRIQRRLYHMS